jgi:hypothetical protein
VIGDEELHHFMARRGRERRIIMNQISSRKKWGILALCGGIALSAGVAGAGGPPGEGEGEVCSLELPDGARHGAEVAANGADPHHATDQDHPRADEGVTQPLRAAFRMADRTTRADLSRIGVHVAGLEGDRVAAVTEAMADSIRILDAEGKEMEATVRTRMDPVGPDGTVNAFVDVEARAWPEGWYEIEVGAIPEAVSFYDQMSPKPATGSASLRFRLGSEPFIRSIKVCEKKGGWRALRVELSEPVSGGDARMEDVISIEGGESECMPTAALAGAPTTLESPRPHLDLACAPAKEPGSVTLELRRGLLSTTGVPVAGAGSRLSLDLPTAEDLEAAPNGCVEFPVE